VLVEREQLADSKLALHQRRQIVAAAHPTKAQFNTVDTDSSWGHLGLPNAART
jgi:hypothetical protein